MFDKVSQIAEQVATGVSRRRFFGRLGQAALTVAGFVAGGLAVPGAGRAAGMFLCCRYACSCCGTFRERPIRWHEWTCSSDPNRCASTSSFDCRLMATKLVKDCHNCG